MKIIFDSFMEEYGIMNGSYITFYDQDTFEAYDSAIYYSEEAKKRYKIVQDIDCFEEFMFFINSEIK